VFSVTPVGGRRTGITGFKTVGCKRTCLVGRRACKQKRGLGTCEMKTLQTFLAIGAARRAILQGSLLFKANKRKLHTVGAVDGTQFENAQAASAKTMQSFDQPEGGLNCVAARPTCPPALQMLLCSATELLRCRARPHALLPQCAAYAAP
jgi:hypothetical protein